MYHPEAEEYPVYISESSEVVKLFQSHSIRCGLGGQDKDEGSFIRLLSLSLLPKVVALPPAVQPCHLFTCGTCIILLVTCFGSLHQQQFSWEGGEFFVVVVVKLSNWIISRQGGWTWGLVWKKGQDHLPSSERLTTSFGGHVWVSQLGWIIEPCSHVCCTEAFFIFAHFSSGWLKLCDYFLGIFELV